MSIRLFFIALLAATALSSCETARVVSSSRAATAWMKRHVEVTSVLQDHSLGGEPVTLQKGIEQNPVPLEPQGSYLEASFFGSLQFHTFAAHYGGRGRASCLIHMPGWDVDMEEPQGWESQKMKGTASILARDGSVIATIPLKTSATQDGSCAAGNWLGMGDVTLTRAQFDAASSLKIEAEGEFRSCPQR